MKNLIEASTNNIFVDFFARKLVLKLKEIPCIATRDPQTQFNYTGIYF